MIVHDVRNVQAVALAQKIEALSLAQRDVVFVIGGDGFLLQTASTLGWERIYLGLNAGHLGFLLNDVDAWDEVSEQLKSSAWRVLQFPLLKATIQAANGITHTEFALNDIYLERMTGQTARITLFFDDHKVVDPLVADGIIVASALGSTAYNFSAGGSACHPELRIMNVTPICPHVPRLSPVCLPENSRVRMIVHRPEHRPVRAVSDGRELNHVYEVEVVYGSTCASLAYFHRHDFTARMVRKLLRP